MKAKEISAIIILILLFGAAVFNIRKTDRLKERIEQHLDAAELYADNADTIACESELQAALEVFLNAEMFTHIFIRHPEIDSTADAFYELLGAVGTDNSAEFNSKLELLRYHIESIASMEHISLGSVM